MFSDCTFMRSTSSYLGVKVNYNILTNCVFFGSRQTVSCFQQQDAKAVVDYELRTLSHGLVSKTTVGD